MLAEQDPSGAVHEQVSNAGPVEAEWMGLELKLSTKTEASRTIVSFFIEVVLLGELGRDQTSGHDPGFRKWPSYEADHYIDLLLLLPSILLTSDVFAINYD
jgi:hypothetical protein